MKETGFQADDNNPMEKKLIELFGDKRAGVKEKS
jgi:hypothetical protein